MKENGWLNIIVKNKLQKRASPNSLKKFVINLRIEPQHLTKRKNSKPSYNSKKSGNKFVQTKASKQLAKLGEKQTAKVREKCPRQFPMSGWVLWRNWLMCEITCVPRVKTKKNINRGEEEKFCNLKLEKRKRFSTASTHMLDWDFTGPRCKLYEGLKWVMVFYG